MQAGALAEFRADWSTAVKTYQTAYSQVQKVPLGNTLPLQHWFELTSVAEQMHIKVRDASSDCLTRRLISFGVSYKCITSEGIRQCSGHLSVHHTV